MATIESLKAKIKKLERQAEALVAKHASGVIEQIHELMATHGLATADIKAHARGKRRLGKTGTVRRRRRALLLSSIATPRAAQRGAVVGVHWRGLLRPRTAVDF
jgi:antitoxin component HigA of HigAB toxin-antitoxin module